jgi:hypothetical protein
MGSPNAASYGEHSGGGSREPRHYRRRKWFRRLQVLFFALTLFGLWWLFSTSTEIVLTCVPGGEKCRLQWVADIFGDRENTSRGTGEKSLDSGEEPGEGGRPSTIREWTVVLFGLVLALWASARLWFPPEDFDVEIDTGGASSGIPGDHT